VKNLAHVLIQVDAEDVDDQDHVSIHCLTAPTSDAQDQDLFQLLLQPAVQVQDLPLHQHQPMHLDVDVEEEPVHVLQLLHHLQVHVIDLEHVAQQVPKQPQILTADSLEQQLQLLLAFKPSL